MGLFTRKSPRSPLLSRPDFGPDYLTAILANVGVPQSQTNLFNLAQRSAMVLGCQGAAYMAQANDRPAFERFVRAFSEPPNDWLNVVDEMAQWLWNWSEFCHEALAAQSDKWARACSSPGGFITANGVEPWDDGKNRSPADDIEAWETVYARNLGR